MWTNPNDMTYDASRLLHRHYGKIRIVDNSTGILLGVVPLLVTTWSSPVLEAFPCEIPGKKLGKESLKFRPTQRAVESILGPALRMLVNNRGKEHSGRKASNKQLKCLTSVTLKKSGLVTRNKIPPHYQGLRVTNRLCSEVDKQIRHLVEVDLSEVSGHRALTNRMDMTLTLLLPPPPLSSWQSVRSPGTTLRTDGGMINGVMIIRKLGMRRRKGRMSK